MKLNFMSLLVWTISSFYLPLAAMPPSTRQLQVLVPESAGSSVHDRGVRSHTRLRVLVVPDAAAATTSQFNTPSSLRAIYHLPATGGANAIAIVDAYHFPTALSDFNSFSQYFGLPAESSTVATAANNKTFQVVYAPGYMPQAGGSYIGSWNLEAALDIEWAHAMAPNAKIYLVEAASDSTSDLDYAVRVAAGLTGVKEISMSWGGSEMGYEAMFFDTVFTARGIVYLASGGDSSDQMEYPAASPNVVSCGRHHGQSQCRGRLSSTRRAGTTRVAAPARTNRVRVSRTRWRRSSARSGASPISPSSRIQTRGVYVFDSTPLWGESGWWILGGTSVAKSFAGGGDQPRRRLGQWIRGQHRGGGSAHLRQPGRCQGL